MVMPGIMPRAKHLFASGFGYLAFLMASIYSMVRLLPAGHPYLNPVYIGQFGIRHVIAEAANHLVVKKENIDQLIIFLALLAAIILLLMQFLMLLWSLVIQPAMANSIFEINTAFSDTSYILLDYVFGIPEFFNSCVALEDICPGADAPAPTFPSPFHVAMHSLFQYYSIGLLLIGMMIFLYFLVVVVVETAVSGTPFGQRFESIWAPVRLIVAIGLLLPLNYGMNSGQYIALYAAKMGANMATNAWLTFNNTIADSVALGAGSVTYKGAKDSITSQQAQERAAKFDSFYGGYKGDFAGGSVGVVDQPNPTGERLSLVAQPKAQDISSLVQAMSLVHACAYAHRIKKRTIQGGWETYEYVEDADAPVQPYFVKRVLPWSKYQVNEESFTETSDYTEGLRFYDDGNIIIRFGKYDLQKYPNETGNVFPTCGEIKISVSDLTYKGQGLEKGGSDYMLMRYFDMVKEMWFADKKFRDFAVRMVEVNTNSGDGGTARACNVGCENGSRLPSCAGSFPDCASVMPAADWKQHMVNTYQGYIDAEVAIAWLLYATNGADMGIGSDIMDRGWAGAGIWYNRLANLNGAFITSVLNVPMLSTYPKVMEDVRDDNAQHNAKINFITQFKPNRASGEPSQIDGGADALETAGALYAVYDYWNKDGANQADSEKVIKGNVFEDAMNMLFGMSGLFAMRSENAHTHPLSQLVAVGKGLVESAIRNMAASTVTAFLGGMGGAMGVHGSGAVSAVSGFFLSTAFIGLTAGFVLFYVLPFLPFVYFYFAVGSWIKTIFEAMVGIPLWALAHLRIDGNGLPGDSAQNGYFLIFEIFIRPILTVFGLIAGMTIFTAQVRILNVIWDLVTNNLAGYNDTSSVYNVVANIEFKRAIIDQFFFTVLYTIVVYMMATASFKLIDKIPDNILRWMGQGISAFGDINQDATESLTKYAAIGGYTIGQQFTGAVQQAAAGAGRAVGGAGSGGSPQETIKHQKDEINALRSELMKERAK